uniref:Uncharacterized protein n=1 Tax=Arundo donax TaxID=35708 RepID=A0A0A9GHE5_ARUDO
MVLLMNRAVLMVLGWTFCWVIYLTSNSSMKFLGAWAIYTICWGDLPLQYIMSP